MPSFMRISSGDRRRARHLPPAAVRCRGCQCYPITRAVDYEVGEDISRFHYNFGAQGTAKALKDGFDAHFVAVDTKAEWQAAARPSEADCHELVVADEQQVLPFARVVVKIK